MGTDDATSSRNEELERSIERQIMQRTWSRIHDLRVEVVDGRIVVHGYTSSYYVKQLALEGVLDVLGSAASVRVDLDIEVASNVPRATCGR
jgi:hypothetical protein